jgi:fructokinase
MPGAPHSRRILVVGEALVDIVYGREIVGGSPANVALGLGRMGADVEFLTAIADDARGARISAHLDASGVRVLPASRTLVRTSTARVQLNEDGGAEYDFDISWMLPGIVQSDHDVLHVGSIACFLEPGASTLVRMLSDLRPLGAWVSFDPNIRPALLDGVDVTGRVEQIAAVARVVKLSDEDARAIYPGLTLPEVATWLLGLGPELVVITRGGEGMLLVSPHHTVTVAAPRVPVVDTVGAGDTVMAALLAHLTCTERWSFSAADLSELGNFCAAAAAITVRRAGADLPTDAEVAAEVTPG